MRGYLVMQQLIDISKLLLWTKLIKLDLKVAHLTRKKQNAQQQVLDIELKLLEINREIQEIRELL